MSLGGSIRGTYWLKPINGVYGDSLGTPLTLEQMKLQSSYEGWDFSSGKVWKMGEECPELIFDPRLEINK